MDKYTATVIATNHAIPLGRDFHSLNSDIVGRIVEAAKAYGYREPKNANGSRARYFYAYLCRSAAGPKWGIEYVLQGQYGHGWEDLTTEATRREANAQAKTYRENAPGLYRVISRRVNLHAE